MTEQEQSLDSLQQSDSKIKKKAWKDISNWSKNTQDDKIFDTVAGRSCSSRDLSPKQIQSVHHNKKQQFRLSKFASSIQPVKQGLYLPSFEEHGVKIDDKCTAITQLISSSIITVTNHF